MNRRIFFNQFYGQVTGLTNPRTLDGIASHDEI